MIIFPAIDLRGGLVVVTVDQHQVGFVENLAKLVCAPFGIYPQLMAVNGVGVLDGSACCEHSRQARFDIRADVVGIQVGTLVAVAQGRDEMPRQLLDIAAGSTHKSPFVAAKTTERGSGEFGVFRVLHGYGFDGLGGFDGLKVGWFEVVTQAMRCHFKPSNFSNHQT